MTTLWPRRPLSDSLQAWPTQHAIPSMVSYQL